MKLVFYAPRFYPLVGGLERVTMAWAHAMHEQGHDITVLTTTAWNGAEIAEYSVRRNASVGEQIRMMKAADAVLCMNISLKALPLLIRAGKPLLVSHHTLLTDGRYKFQMRQQLKRWICNRFAKLNICCSAFVAKPLKNTVVVHSPYNADLFYNKHVPRAAGSLLFVGRLVSDKGVHVLLRAFAKAKAMYDGPLTLKICGDGPEKGALHQFVLQQGLQDSVLFSGSVSQEQAAQLMNTHQLLLVPSLVEPFGTVVPEGLACGCSVICSNTGGLPEAAGAFATLVAPNNEDGLAKEIVSKLYEPLRLPQHKLAAHLHTLSTSYSVHEVLSSIQNTL